MAYVHCVIVCVFQLVHRLPQFPHLGCIIFYSSQVVHLSAGIHRFWHFWHVVLFATSCCLQRRIICSVVLLQVLSCVEWCNSATKELSCALWARTSEAKPQHMVVDVDCDRTIDFPEFPQLMAFEQDEDYRL